MFTITRITSSGKSTVIKIVDTRRKANNVMDRTQENSSKSSTIVLTENGVVLDTRNGLL